KLHAQQLQKNFALAWKHVQVRDTIIKGAQAQLVLQDFQIGKLHQSLNHKEKKEKTDQTKLNPGGKGRLLTA
ncbi:hypothetical protein M422DRAFT_141559, partial [Sphaerobolus stellatus SS14]